MKRLKGLAASCAVHGVVIAVVVFVTTSREAIRSDTPVARYEPPTHVIWLSVPGPGGGGGGGGRQEQSPARAAEVKGADKVTMPSAARETLQVAEKPKPPDPLPDVPVQTLGASDLTAMGLIEAGAESPSHGPGRKGGFGPGDGTGAGPGVGPGLGPGRDGGMGDGPHKPGSGVSMPIPVHQEKPQYTIEAMRARIEGAVVVECVVQPTGVCTQLRVVRSLDARLGLDQQALRAAAGWRFSPGMRFGKPVAVVVYIQVGFSIH
jgi:TonB family protein